MSVDDQFGETKNLSAQVEGVTETTLLTLLGRESLDRLQVHVVIEMELQGQQTNCDRQALT